MWRSRAETLRAIQKLLESCIGGYGETIRREEVERDNMYSWNLQLCGIRYQTPDHLLPKHDVNVEFTEYQTHINKSYLLS